MEDERYKKIRSLISFILCHLTNTTSAIKLINTCPTNSAA
jgi:hypothetical protein